MKDAKPKKAGKKQFGVRMSAEEHAAIREGAEKTRLSESDLARMAIEKGLPLVLRALGLSGEQIAALAPPDSSAAA